MSRPRALAGALLLLVLAACTPAGADEVGSTGPATSLGTPAAPPPGDGGFAVLARAEDGSPVRWEACRPIRYVLDRRTAPAGGDYLLRGALDDVSRVTGLVFTEVGPTREAPSDGRRAVQERYGDGWAPVLVSWSDPEATPGLAGDVAAFAGPQTASGPGGAVRRYVTGQLALDGPQLAESAAGPAGLARARAVVLHELGHLVGLDHVGDPSQLMYPSTTPLVVDFRDGDLRGLAAVSGGPCTDG